MVGNERIKKRKSAVKNNIDFATLETQLKYTISTPLERAQELFAALGLK